MEGEKMTGMKKVMYALVGLGVLAAAGGVGFMLWKKLKMACKAVNMTSLHLESLATNTGSQEISGSLVSDCSTRVATLTIKPFSVTVDEKWMSGSNAYFTINLPAVVKPVSGSVPFVNIDDSVSVPNMENFHAYLHVMTEAVDSRVPADKPYISFQRIPDTSHTYPNWPMNVGDVFAVTKDIVVTWKF